MQSMKWHSASSSEIARARRLRAEMTEVERRLWFRLRGEQILSCRFRRQVPIGDYVVDFACMKAQLVVEVDGGQHDAASADDARRTAWLESQGYRVLRFWNTDVLQEPDAVVESIREALLRPPPQPSSPNGEGEARAVVGLKKQGD